MVKEINGKITYIDKYDEETVIYPKNRVEDVEGLSGRLANLQQNIDTLEGSVNARMDTFASLPNGSTTGDAELLDLRVQADGTIAKSAGDAVRNQIKDIKTDISGAYSFNADTTYDNLGDTLRGAVKTSKDYTDAQISAFKSFSCSKSFLVNLFSPFILFYTASTQ